jgi:hypothetical protein
VVRVLIPPTAERPHPVDLLLCGHHYLRSRAALAAASAVAIDETGSTKIDIAADLVGDTGIEPVTSSV